MQCEVCGKDEAGFKTVIEGTSMVTCVRCKTLGPSQQIVHKQAFSKPVAQKIEEESIVEGYGSLIKQAREKKGLSQEEFSMKISEKDSIIKKIEVEHAKPPISLAKKIEKFLGITLVEVITPIQTSSKESKSQQLTIGDKIKIRKR